MSRDITLLHPDLQKIIPQFLEECKRQGLNVKITDTFRTKKEQDDLYAQGRTKPGNIVTWVKYPNSFHNWGLAFDICRNDGKDPYDNSDGFFDKVGEIGKKFGLFWGGDWKDTPDKPHFELTKFGTIKELEQKYKTPENFKKTWKKEQGYLFVNRNYRYNNKIKAFDVINENGENYIRVRDLCYLLNKEISYNDSTKITTIYDIIEKKPILIDNKETEVQCINSEGFNYINAREIGDALGYEVGYNETENKMFFKFKKSLLEKLKKITTPIK